MNQSSLTCLTAQTDILRCILKCLSYTGLFLCSTITLQESILKVRLVANSKPKIPQMCLVKPLAAELGNSRILCLLFAFRQIKRSRMRHRVVLFHYKNLDWLQFPCSVYLHIPLFHPCLWPYDPNREILLASANIPLE